MAEYKVELSQGALANPQEAIQCLIEASENIANSSESDFNELKERKWYKRLWNVVTFSKDNEKKMAKGISNLAKLQELVMKAIVILSTQCAETAEIVKDNSETIEALCKKADFNSKVQSALIKEIEAIKSGIEQPLAIDDLTDNKRILIVNSVITVAEELNSQNELGQEYLNALFRSSRCSALYLQEDINYEFIEELTAKEAALLYKLIMEYLYIVSDDFECDSEIIDYINVNKKRSVAIKNQIKRMSFLAGKSTLLNSFDNIEETVFSEDDIEFEEILESANAEITASQEVVAIEDYEECVINRMINISNGEIKSFKNQKISISSKIICYGTLELDNCFVYFNEEDFANNILLKDGANLTAKNTEFVCLDKLVDEFCIKAENNSSIDFDSCKFNTCVNFLKADQSSIVSVNNCSLINCFTDVIRFGGWGERSGKCEIINTTIHNDRPHSFLGKLNKEYDLGENMFTVYGKDSLIADVYINESKEYGNFIREYLKKSRKVNVKYFEVPDGTIENCTFKSLSTGINALSVWNCLFEECTGAVETKESWEYTPNVTSCTFLNCANAIAVDDNTKVTKCKFIGCGDRIIYSSTFGFDGGITIKECEFINCFNNTEDRYQGLDIDYSIGSIELSVSKKGNDSIIENCVFDGININEGFLIKTKILESVNSNVYIRNCDFKNCVTKRKSGKIIKECASYLGAFNKTKTLKIVNIENCKGLDNINKQGSTTNNANAVIIDHTVGSKVGKAAFVAVGMAVAGPLGAVGVAASGMTVAATLGTLGAITTDNLYTDRNKNEVKNIELKNSSEEYTSFMVVSDVFTITGRGPVVVGYLEKGEFTLYDDIYLLKENGDYYEAKIAGLEINRKLYDVVKSGNNVGVLLEKIKRSEISVGDKIVKY